MQLCLFSIQLLKSISRPFHLTYSLLPFVLITFSFLNSLDLFFLSLLTKSCNNLFSIKIFYQICPQHSIFNFFNSRHLLIPMRNVTFCRNRRFTKFKLKIFKIVFFIKFNICFSFYIKILLFFSYIICTVLFFVTKFINIHILLY